MTDYAIAFDFPEFEGDPWFASLIGDAPGWTSSLATAETFPNEDAAQRFLKISYGPAIAAYGDVVEVVA